MERKDFFKKAGMAATFALIPFSKLLSENASVCTEMPTEDEGPFPYPGGEITNPLQRVDIRDGQTGVQFDMTINLISSIDCLPIVGGRIDIWHCNKDGWYSGYDGQNGGVTGTSANHANETWLRGYQITDANGQIHFTSVYPGWYLGRATHVHLEVFINNVMVKRGQLAFVKADSDAVHTSSLYSAHGVNSTLDANDGIFGVANPGGSGNAAVDLANETFLLSGSVANGYTGTYTLAVNSVSNGIGNISDNSLRVSVHPNPETKNIVVSHDAFNSPSMIRIMGIDGKAIIVKKIDAGTTKSTVDGSGLSTGIYLLILENESRSQAAKFVIQ